MTRPSSAPLRRQLQAALDVPAVSRMPVYAPLNRFCDDPFGPLAGYENYDGTWGTPSWSYLRGTMYPILEACMDAYYASLDPNFKRSTEFLHHLHYVRHFLRDGADVDGKDESSGATALHFAAGSGCVELVDLLLLARSRASARDRRLKTPLWWAIAGGHLPVCKRLLPKAEKGASGSGDASRVATLPDIAKMTPLHEASALGWSNIVRHLATFYAPKPGVDVRGGVDMKTPLHVAAEILNFDACQTLLEAEADPQVSCSHGKTALHYAAEHGAGGFELCAILVERKPACRRLRDASGRTPIDLAYRAGWVPDELQTVLWGPTDPATGVREDPVTSIRGAAGPKRGMSHRR